ncbi:MULTISPECIES: helix-turn-helix transcriptional regulator [Paraliobacillus]|nr:MULTISPECIES: helix-turn-helix transcriptional regulator [Paraliobacillus]
MKNNIKQLRKSAKLSQEELAKHCKVSRQTINAIENDKYDPTLQLAFELASVLDTSVDQLFISNSIRK